MCYIISSTGRTGRTPFAKACNGLTFKEAKAEALKRRAQAQMKEIETFEQWGKLLIKHTEFSVDVCDKAKRFADFLTRSHVHFYTEQKNGFTTFKLA